MGKTTFVLVWFSSDNRKLCTSGQIQRRFPGLMMQSDTLRNKLYQGSRGTGHLREAQWHCGDLELPICVHDTTCSLSSLLALTPTILKPAVLNADGGFSGGSAGNNLPANAGDVGSIPGSRRSLEGGNGNLLQYSCLGNPPGRGVWRATVHGVTRRRTRLSN